MGITGLLPFLRGIQREVHVSSFRGRKVAVDAYCWLHKGAYSCATQLVVKPEKLETLPFIKYCMKRVNMLIQHNVTPVMVFDGGYLPTKAQTEKTRRERRDTYLQKGKALLKEGRDSEANECFRKGVDVTPEMALALIKECRRTGVECIVAPYEADAQLAFLQKEGIVDLVVSEDSDLLVFGCSKVLYKMDDSGTGQLIELKDLGKANKTLVGFTQHSFRQMCILSGCDYLASIPGVGLAKASKYMRKYRQDPYRVIKQINNETAKVPPGYEDSFRRAEHTFLYQIVFDPRTQTQVRLNRLVDNVDPSEFEIAGVESSPRKAIALARGNVNPITHSVMDTYSPSKASPVRSTASWGASAMAAPGKQYPLPIQSTLHLSSSKGIGKPFRPPKRAVLTEDESLKDEELQAIYGTVETTHSIQEPLSSTPTNSYRKAVVNCSDLLSLEVEETDAPRPVRRPVKPNSITVSKYFSQQPSLGVDSESTPAENEVQMNDRVARRLRLSSYGMERAPTNTSSPAQEDCVPDTVMEQHGGHPTEFDNASQHHESVPESPTESADTPHPLQKSPSVQNPAKKKLSFSGPSEECSQSRGETDDVLSFRRGPSLVASVEKTESRTGCFPSSPRTANCEAALEATAGDPVHSMTAPSFPHVQLHEETGARSPTNYTQVDADSEDRCSRCRSPPSVTVEGDRPPVCRSYLTSGDFVVSAISACGCSTPKQSTLVASHCAEGLQQTPVAICSSSNSRINLVDDRLDSGQSQMNLKPSRQPSMLLQKLTSQKWSSKTKPPKVGLSRRRSSSAFKPPRQSEAGLRQTSLFEEFSCQKKPRMA